MCGFLADISPSLISEQDFHSLLNLSRRRGPDQQEVWTDGAHCQMGFNRLAILDVSDKGRQPLHSPSGRFVVMLNGEIYNYKDLQHSYGIADNDLRSGSDAEVIAQLLDRLSVSQLLPQLDGMFALSVYDRKAKTVTLARDFAGIKPLYYGIAHNTLVLASQFNQVFRHPAFRGHLQLRAEIVKEYMGLGYMQAPNTVFKNIYQLQPGEYLVYDVLSQRITEQKFYYQWQEDPRISETDRKLPEQFNKLFGKVVQSQLQSDVPLATFLSGGIDSPLVTAHAHAGQKGIRAYTLKVDDPLLNESEIAAGYAAHLGIKQELLHLSEADLLESIAAHFKDIPEPHGDYSSIPTYAICKQARQHATVMLSGDGGDELFWGYSRFIRSIKYLQWFKYPRWVRKATMPFKRRFDFRVSKGPELFETFGEWTLHKQLNLFRLETLVPDSDYSEELKKVYAFSGSNLDEAVLYLKRNEFHAHMQRVLRKVDLMSMANSVEVRVPFLSKELIAFSNTIRPQLGMTHQNPKWVLKKALEQFIPASSIEQEKRGFTVPIEQWMRGPLKADIEQTLLHRPIFGAELLNIPFLHSLVRDFLSGKPISAWGIWQIYAWQKWADENMLLEI